MAWKKYENGEHTSATPFKGLNARLQRGMILCGQCALQKSEGIQNVPVPFPSGQRSSFTSFTSYAFLLAAMTANRQGERELIAHVQELEIFGFRERHIPRPVHSFVTISIDGEQQAEISHSVDTLNPKWVFDKPLQLMVRASSTIRFTVYREHVVLSKFGNNNHCCGDTEMELQTVLINPYTLHKLQSPVYSRENNLEFRVRLELEPKFRHETLLQHAQDRLQRHDNNRDLKRKSSAMSLIGFAVDNLDQVVNIVDGLVEIHPMCKVAWMVLGSVYKAFKDQHTLDHSANELAQELKETLAYAKECRGLKAIPEATDVLLEIAKLVVQSAAAFDTHMRYSLTSRVLISAVTKSSQKRISDCEQRLKVLRKKLQENLVIRIFQGQNELLTDNGLRNNNSTPWLPRQYTTKLPIPPPLYIPPKERHRPGYAPVYTSAPPSDESYEPLRQPSPPPLAVLSDDDSFRRFTSSPEPIDPPMFMPQPPPLAATRSSLPNPYSPKQSMWSPWPMASRTPSLATDSGRTLSSKSSCSSLSEPCDCPHYVPDVFDPGDQENCPEGRTTPAGWHSLTDDSAQSGMPHNFDLDPPRCKRNLDAAQTNLPLAMPTPMSWSQINLDHTTIDVSS